MYKALMQCKCKWDFELLQNGISSGNLGEVLFLSRAQIWDVAQVSKTGRKQSLEVVDKSKVDKQVLDKEMLLVALEL